MATSTTTTTTTTVAKTSASTSVGLRASANATTTTTTTSTLATLLYATVPSSQRRADPATKAYARRVADALLLRAVALGLQAVAASQLSAGEARALGVFFQPTVEGVRDVLRSAAALTALAAGARLISVKALETRNTLAAAVAHTAPHACALPLLAVADDAALRSAEATFDVPHSGLVALRDGSVDAAECADATWFARANGDVWTKCERHVAQKCGLLSVKAIAKLFR